MVVRILAALIAASFGATDATSGTSPASAAPKPEIIQLYMAERRALVMLRVGDAAPVPVVFDTGTNGNLVDTGVAARLNLPHVGPSEAIDGSTGKPVPGYRTTMRGARLGGIPIADGDATVLAYDLPDEVGIFGPNSFPGRLVEMDGPRSRLLVRDKNPGVVPAGEGTPYLGDGGAALPSAVLDFGGLAVPAILDTGNDSAIILPTAYKDKLLLEAPPVVVGHAVSAAGKQPILQARLAGKVQIGNVTLVKPRIMFMDGGRPNVGLPVLRRIKVVYDHSGSRSWIVSPPTTIE